jgi:cysteinyl-tRNA synthetase
VTDIDDDILRRPKGEPGLANPGQSLDGSFYSGYDLSERSPPDHFPRATDIIAPIVNAVQTLLAAVAYESGGNVYFDIAAWPSTAS